MRPETDRGQMGPNHHFLPMFIAAIISMMTITLVLDVLGFEEDGQTELSRESAEAMQETMAAVVELALAVAGLAVIVAVITAIGPQVIGLLRNRKQYPVNTIALQSSRRWIDRTEQSPHGCESCINCELEDVKGGTVRFGTDTVLFGFVTSRTVVGEFDECQACADADSVEYALRAERDQPEPPAATWVTGGESQ